MFLPIRVSSWEEAQDVSRKLPYWNFRGQANASWHLSSRIEREAMRFSDDLRYLPLPEIEARILYDFRRRAHHYLISPPAEDQLLEWLAIIQHHGGPTRLLDFSYSFHVAAFFAMESAAVNQDASVWGINRDALHDKLIPKTCGTKTELSYQSNQRHIEIAERILKERTEEKLVLNLEPFRLSERVAIQQGLFLFPCDIRASFQENLAQTFDCPSSLFEINDVVSIDKLLVAKMGEVGIVKIVIPYSFHANALRDLRRMNITTTTLYPGLDGFARSFNFYVRPI